MEMVDGISLENLVGYAVGGWSGSLGARPCWVGAASWVGFGLTGARARGSATYPARAGQGGRRTVACVDQAPPYRPLTGCTGRRPPGSEAGAQV